MKDMKVKLRNLQSMNNGHINIALKHIGHATLLVFLKNVKYAVKEKFLNQMTTNARNTVLSELPSVPNQPRSQEALAILAVLDVVEKVQKGTLV